MPQESATRAPFRSQERDDRVPLHYTSACLRTGFDRGRQARLAAGEPPARSPDVVALLVLDGRVGADHRRSRQRLRARVADVRVERARREAAALDVPEHRAGRVGHGDRGLPAEPRERERALGVDLADARRLRSSPLSGKFRKPAAAEPGVEALDQAEGVLHAGLLHEQALEQVDARVELPVDVVDDVVDRRALLARSRSTLAMTSSRPAVILRSCRIVATR